MSTKYTNTKHNWKIWKLNNVYSGGQAPEYQWSVYNETIGSVRPEGTLHHYVSLTQSEG